MGTRACDNRGCAKSSCKIRHPVINFDIIIPNCGDDMRCEDNAILRKPLPEVCKTNEIGSVPLTNGIPSHTPSPDQIPLAYDRARGVLYLFTNKWEAFGLNSLTEVNLANMTNLDNVLRVPVSYNTGTQQVEGYLTLKDFKNLL